MRKKVKTETPSAAAGGGKESNGDQMDVDGEAGAGRVPVKEEINGDDDGGMVFTSTTEFTSRLEVSYRSCGWALPRQNEPSEALTHVLRGTC